MMSEQDHGRHHDDERDHEKPPVLPFQEQTPPTQPMARQTKRLPFAGRLGGNQALVLERDESSKGPTLDRVPDASPFMTRRRS